YIQAQGKIKDMEVDVATFKHNGQSLIAVATPKPIHISDLIPEIGKTSLDDVSFDNMTYVWAPKGIAKSQLNTATNVPPMIAAVAQKAGQVIDVKEGLNVLGQLGIAQSGELGKLLSMANLYKNSLPLSGSLNPAVFQKGNTA
ncbi:hypothetical protein WH96_20930, partial [Kiloniella spongiae]